MGTEQPLLSQKEYLKKYLGKDKTKKKKKKPKFSSSSHIKRSVIIDDDDDLGLKDNANIEDEEFNLDYLGDEAPQIVGIVDERPTELRAKEKYNSNLWRAIGQVDTEDRSDVQTDKLVKHGSDSDSSDLRNKNYLAPRENNEKHKHDGRRAHSDRERSVDIRNGNSDLSPPRKQSRKVKNSDSDLSPPRSRGQSKIKALSKRVRSQDDSRNSDSDLSPQRSSRSSKKFTHVKDRSRCSRSSDSDLSPERVPKSRRTYSRDNTKETHSRNDYPARRGRDHSKEDRSHYKSRSDRDRKIRDQHSDSDYRSKDYKYRDKEKRQNERDYHRKYDLGKKNKSPSTYDQGTSNHKKKEKHSKENAGSDLSPERNNARFKQKIGKSKSNTEEKMLDGKKSGLQDAKHLKEELKKLRENEDQHFKKMDPSILGANAAPIRRDRKTGQIRDLSKEREEDRVKAAKKAKTDEKYYKWGRGLKQIQEREDRVADAIHEMSKPLARYKDDKDLDAMLKAREREGDPMLNYIKSKQAESHNVIDLSLGPEKRKYNGSFMPNRFGIPPGYRWDGVDRSNGYEKKWFEQRNARKAVEEEAYKWSTSDM